MSEISAMIKPTIDAPIAGPALCGKCRWRYDLDFRALDTLVRILSRGR